MVKCKCGAKFETTYQWRIHYHFLRPVPSSAYLNSYLERMDKHDREHQLITLEAKKEEK